MKRAARSTALAAGVALLGLALWLSQRKEVVADVEGPPSEPSTRRHSTSSRTDASAPLRRVSSAGGPVTPPAVPADGAPSRRWPAPVTRPTVPEREDGAPPSPQAAGRRDDQGRRIQAEPPSTEAELQVAASARSAVVAAWPKAQRCLGASAASLRLTVDVDAEGEAFFGGATVPGQDLSPDEERCLDEVFADLPPGASPTRPLIVEVPAP